MIYIYIERERELLKDQGILLGHSGCAPDETHHSGLLFVSGAPSLMILRKRVLKLNHPVPKNPDET